MYVVLFSIWGGVVRALMNSRGKDKKVISHIIVSSFTGIMCALYFYENNYSTNMIIVASGISSTLGGSLLRWVWKVVHERFSQGGVNN